ncbi:GlsB/YeaQ/YmgE family stress response membrane protein [Gracilimonas amylolytica]|uniref:GlsB/YeaQ/YmgE family stress response membrane protein n=1 Tax=Gracilimonas amylolytica TaxID=1749045 RepID=UPI000CD920EF|nr:hypothetical protein [Gracilimonas amylolytica]
MTLMNVLAYITIGLIIGWLSRIISKDRGITMFPSLTFGVAGALAGTAIVYLFDLAGAAIYAAVGAFALLFIVNTFRQDDPIFTDTEAI